MPRKQNIIANRLWKYRTVMGLSQKEVASRLKLKCSSMVSRWEQGKDMPNGDYLLMLSILYKTLPNELYRERVYEHQKLLFPTELDNISMDNGP